MPNDADSLTEQTVEHAVLPEGAENGVGAPVQSNGSHAANGHGAVPEQLDEYAYDDQGYDDYEDDFDASEFADDPFFFEDDGAYEQGYDQYGAPMAQPVPGDVMVIDEPEYGAPPRRRPQRMSRAERRRRVL